MINYKTIVMILPLKSGFFQMNQLRLRNYTNNKAKTFQQHHTKGLQ